jgi:CRP/FNR family transcriptional regulator, cyclic AMP receptor protein
MYEDALARVDLFSGLREKELKDLATYCSESTYRPGSVLLSQGEQGLGLFILTKGTVRITRVNSPDGAEEVLGTAGAGDVIGEMALLDDMPRSATVTAVDEVTVLKLPLWEFRRILRHILSTDPDVGLDLLAVLSRRLRKAEQRANE